MSIIIDFGAGIVLDNKKIDKTVDSVISAIKKELPEEALCMATIIHILNATKEKVQCKRTIL